MEHNNKNNLPILGAVMMSCLLLLSRYAQARSLEEAVEPKSELLSQNFIDVVKAAKETTDPQTKKICAKTANPVLCEQTVTALNKEPVPVNPRNVVLFQVGALKQETALAHEDCKNANPESGDKEGFQFCKGSYEKAEDELGMAVDACQSNDLKATVEYVQGSMTHFEKCKKDLESNDKAGSPLTQVNEYLTKVGENCVSIANAITDGSIDNNRRRFL